MKMFKNKSIQIKSSMIKSATVSRKTKHVFTPFFLAIALNPLTSLAREGSGHSGGGGKFSAQGGIVSCYEKDSGFSVRFLPYTKVAEFRSSINEAYEPCLLTDQSLNLNLDAIESQFLKKSGTLSEMSAWLQNPSIITVNIKSDLQDYGVAGPVLTCGQKKLYFRASAQALRLTFSGRPAGAIASAAFQLVDETDARNVQVVFKVQTQCGLTAGENAVIGEGWSCTNYNENFIGNYTGPNLKGLSDGPDLGWITAVN